MKPLKQHEIYQNLSNFLKTRGIELQEGSYSQGIQKSCSFLTDAINLSQHSWERARVELNKSMDQLRQCIHEKTAPKKAKTTGAATPPQASAQSKRNPKAARKKAVRRKAGS